MRQLALPLILVAAASACLAPSAVECADGSICPAGRVCITGGCALPEQISACAGQPEGATCGFASSPRAYVWAACVSACRVATVSSIRGRSADEESQQRRRRWLLRGLPVDRGVRQRLRRCHARRGVRRRRPAESRRVREQVPPRVPEWHDRSPRTPPRRYIHAMAYDAARGRVVVVGGIDNASGNLVRLGTPSSGRGRVGST